MLDFQSQPNTNGSTSGNSTYRRKDQPQADKVSVSSSVNTLTSSVNTLISVLSNLTVKINLSMIAGLFVDFHFISLGDQLLRIPSFNESYRFL